LVELPCLLLDCHLAEKCVCTFADSLIG